MFSRLLSILSTFAFTTTIAAQSALDIDTLVILSDTVSIYQIEPRPVRELALPECARPDSNFMRQTTLSQSDEMQLFIEKMDSVVLFGKGRVNILHIGGSHVQADIYTNVFRQNIDSLNGELMPPRGLIFPYSVAHTNNPSSYKVRYGGNWIAARNALKQFYPNQGVCGILAYTTDTTAWFSIDLNPDSTIRWTTNKLHLIGESMRGNCTPMLHLADTIIAPQRESTGYLFNLPDAKSQFTIQLHFDSLATATLDTFVVRGLMVDNDEAGIIYSTIGVNGASVPSYLGCTHFETDLALLKPDLAIFAIGINDATASNFSDSIFVANYDSLLTHIRNVSPHCAFVFITNNDSFRRIRRNRYSVNKNGLIAQQGFYTLAQKWQAPVWDLFEIMGGLGSMQKWQTAHLAQKDKVHFTREGYYIIGQMFFDAFMDYYLNFDIQTEQ